MHRDLFQQAFSAMRHDLRRTLLTMAGMAWGIATVVLLLAYGNGFGRAIQNIFESFGATAVGVFPGRTSQQAGGNKAPGRAGAVWFYCNAENGRHVYAAIDRWNSFTTATFTGYFHFVPDPKNRGKHMFDPGRLQVEVVGVSDVAKSQTPWVSTGR